MAARKAELNNFQSRKEL